MKTYSVKYSTNKGVHVGFIRVNHYFEIQSVEDRKLIEELIVERYRAVDPVLMSWELAVDGRTVKKFGGAA